MARARWRRWRRALLALIGSLALPIGAQQPPDYPYEAPDQSISQSVARISYIDGNVAYARGDDPDQWQDADVNVPMTIGDRVYTGQGSLELQLERGALVELGSRTDLATLNLTDQVSQFAVKAGVSSFAIPRLSAGEIFEVDTPNAAVTFDQPGHYRVDVDESGQTRVVVRRGNATVAAGGGQLVVGDGEAILIEGTDTPRYEVVATPPPDRWDAWAQTRQDRELRAASLRYVSPGVVGAADLEGYGRWDTIPEYGRVWTPLSVEAGWAPYRHGHWCWQDPWGWTWISTEPWGWAPYHYGRWVTVGPQWYWVPVAPAVASVSYAPALVAFVGGPGVGVGVSVTAGPAFVGWFPLAPRDPLNAWWGPRAHEVNVTQVTNVTYVNRTYVTVVNQNTFVSGASVAPAVVRESTTLRQVAAAPVVVGRVPVTPTVSSTRVSARAAGSAPRPPAAVVSRSVVTRAVPPPAPPRFEQKLAVIRESRAPVAPAAAARIASKAAAPAPVVPMRPAASEGGNVKLAPRRESEAQQKRVEPMTASRVPAQRAASPPAGAREAQTQAATPVPGRAQPGLEPRSGAEARSGAAPAPRPTSPAAEGRRPDEPSLAAPPAGVPRPGAERPPAPADTRPSERPESERERELVRPTPPRIAPTRPAPYGGRERESAPGEKAAPPQNAPRRESVESSPRSQLRPTPSYMNPHRRPTPPSGRVTPERETAPPEKQRESAGTRNAAPPAGREEANPAPRSSAPGRVATPSSEAPERDGSVRNHPETSRGRRPTPRPTPKPD